MSMPAWPCSSAPPWSCAARCAAPGRGWSCSSPSRQRGLRLYLRDLARPRHPVRRGHARHVEHDGHARPCFCCSPASRAAAGRPRRARRRQPPIRVSRAARPVRRGSAFSTPIATPRGPYARRPSAAPRRPASGRRARRLNARWKDWADRPEAIASAAATPLVSAMAMPSPASEAITAAWSPTR